MRQYVKITRMWRRWDTPQRFEKIRRVWRLMSSFYNCIPKVTIIWCMLPEICHFGPFFPFYLPNNPENQDFEKVKKSLEMSSFYTCVPEVRSYDVCFLRYGVRQTKFFVILGHFWPFHPINDPKNQNSKKKM